MATQPPTLTEARAIDLGRALSDVVLRPSISLWPAWSWKAAAISAVFRASTFFATNLKAGSHKAMHAMLVEAVFAIFAAGLLGAVSQHLRHARPFWATAAVVWLGMPGLITIAQFALHRAAGTQYLGAGLAASFCFAALASSFSWYAMSQGALLGGAASTTLKHDIEALPRIVVGYTLAPFRIFRRGASR